MMNKQLDMFPDTIPKLDMEEINAFIKMRMYDKAYQEMKSVGISTLGILLKVIENQKIDFLSALESYEDSGTMVYMDLTINGIKYCVQEGFDTEGVVILIGDNEAHLFHMTETDIYDDKLQSKIKKKIIAYITNNIAQIEYLIEQKKEK